MTFPQFYLKKSRWFLPFMSASVIVAELTEEGCAVIVCMAGTSLSRLGLFAAVDRENE